MDIKKILIVSSSFYPQKSPRSYRTTELVKEFARQGHSVTLLTIKDEKAHTGFEKKYGVAIKDMGRRKLPKIDLFTGNGAFRFLKKAANAGLRLFFEYPDIELMGMVKKALKEEEGYDLLISIAMPHPVHWGIARSRSESHPIADIWAADCGDPYMGFTMDRFNKPVWFKYVEKMFCRKADFITVPIEAAKNAYYSEFLDKIRVIPQGFNFDEVDRKTYQENRVPTFAYAGNLLGGGRNPDKLLNYLVNLDRDFRFIIYTQKASPVRPYLEKAGKRIEIRDYIPRKDLLKEMSGMDFLVNLENSSSTQLPSKLIDYYLSGRPVLSVESGELSAEIVDEFLDGDYSGKYQFDDVDSYRIENVCNSFLSLCI